MMERLHGRAAVNFFSLYKNNDFIYKEKERLIIRWLITAIVTSILFYAIVTTGDILACWAVTVAIAYFLINTVRFFSIKRESPPKFISSLLYFDILILSLPLMVAPQIGGFLAPLLLFLVISSGLNYGHRIMIRCTTCVITLFTIAVLVSPYWQQNISVMLSVYLMMLVIPFYLIPIMKNLEINTLSLNEKAHKDHLTGLRNRTTLHSKIQSSLMNSKKNNKNCALFYFDLDNFKKVNDELGHKAGDNLLVAVSKNLRKEFRSDDAIFRLGGDEFFIITEGINSRESAEALGEKILRSVKAAGQKIAPSLAVSSSIGLLYLTPSEIDSNLDVKSYVALADGAMYEAKKTGKSRLVFAK